MINCEKCGAFISHDSSNLPYICDACKGTERIKELEAEIEKLKAGKEPPFSVGCGDVS